MLPAIVTGNGGAIDTGVADVLGTGAALLLFATLSVTPIVTLTGARWVLPLRKWYGVMTAVTALLDAILAAITTSFPHGPAGRLAGHTFLLVGLTMAVLFVPLVLTANNYSKRQLGKYWKVLQRLTYVIWFLLGVHLALLFNLGPHSGGSVFHQRFYQYLAVSIPLVFFRLPPVRKWAIRQRKHGGWQFAAVAELFIVLFAVGFVFMVNELIFKGVDMFNLHPSTN